MLTSIHSAGVAAEVNLRIIQARKYTKKGSTLTLKPRANITRSLKQGYQWSHEKDLRGLGSFETKSLDLRNIFCRSYLVNTR